MFSSIRNVIARHHVKFRQNRSNSCGDIEISRFSKMAAAAILDFQKYKFLMAGTFGRANLRYSVNFCQDRSIRCWDMANFRYFKMAAVRHVRFFKIAILNIVPHKECQCASPCQISSKSVEWLQRYCDFSVFQNGGRRHLGFSKIQILNG